MRAITFFLSMMLLGAGVARGDEPTSPGSSSPAAEAVEEVLVTGEQPGPALWKVTSGEHVLWILG